MPPAQSLPRFSALKLLKAVAVSTVVAVLTASVAVIVSYLFFPVSGVEISGARMFPESAAWEAVPKYASLLSLNTPNLEREIESNPWVKGATVIKDWDSGIVTVQVEEREAALNGNLNGQRIILAEDGRKLPGLGGANLERVELNETRLEEILKVSEVLGENGVMLDSVDKASPGGFEATVAGRHVLFGGSLSEEQARTLVALMEDHPDAAYFDVRSPGRIVVGPESSG